MDQLTVTDLQTACDNAAATADGDPTGVFDRHATKPSGLTSAMPEVSP